MENEIKYTKAKKVSNSEIERYDFKIKGSEAKYENGTYEIFVMKEKTVNEFWVRKKGYGTMEMVIGYLKDLPIEEALEYVVNEIATNLDLYQDLFFSE